MALSLSDKANERAMMLLYNVYNGTVRSPGLTACFYLYNSLFCKIINLTA